MSRADWMASIVMQPYCTDRPGYSSCRISALVPFLRCVRKNTLSESLALKICAGGERRRRVDGGLSASGAMTGNSGPCAVKTHSATVVHLQALTI